MTEPSLQTSSKFYRMSVLSKPDPRVRTSGGGNLHASVDSIQGGGFFFLFPSSWHVFILIEMTHFPLYLSYCKVCVHLPMADNSQGALLILCVGLCKHAKVTVRIRQLQSKREGKIKSAF